MRLAVALRKLYTPEQILEVYVNHCFTSDNGLIGCKDIARALFNRDLRECSDAQCVYLARMVKWGRNTKDKIVLQCKSDMSRMGKANGWNRTKQQAVIEEIKRLTFYKLKRIQTENGLLVTAPTSSGWQCLKRTVLRDLSWKTWTSLTPIPSYVPRVTAL